MRILYVSYETPIHPAGGIATYLEYMAAGMQAAGHEVFLFSWTDAKDYVEPLDYTPFQRDHVHIERINKHEIWRVIPVDSENLYLATWLSERIQAKIKEWQIDVVEATDWLAPCLALYQEMQGDTTYALSVLDSYLTIVTSIPRQLYDGYVFRGGPSRGEPEQSGEPVVRAAAMPDFGPGDRTVAGVGGASCGAWYRDGGAADPRAVQLRLNERFFGRA